MERIDKLLRKVERDLAENTIFIHSIYDTSMSGGQHDIHVILWDGKTTGLGNGLELSKSFATEAEAEAYIAKLYKEYPAPRGRKNGPVICYSKEGQEVAGTQQQDDEQAEVV